MKNIAITVQYDGSNYHGWQRQDNAITVQQVIEEALHKITGIKTLVNGCGRTDAKVHAIEYVANFNTSLNIPVDRLPYAINQLLPEDICCFSSRLVLPEFHARFSAKRKKYIYKIDNSVFGNVFTKNYTWHYKYPLDYKKMCEAAKLFKGTHDFKAFCASGSTAKTTIRTIFETDLYSNKDIITFEVVGNGFLYNMVRIMVGSLVYIGCGKMNLSDLMVAINGGMRQNAGITAPPQGLYMAKVYYDNY